MIAIWLLCVFVASASARSRIVNGEKAGADEFPYQVSLRTTGGSLICGGAVLNENWVITAAHCTTGKAQDYMVYVNDRHLSSTDSNEERIGVATIHQHPNYNSGSGAFPNDVSLLQLEEPIYNVNAIALHNDEAIDMTNCLISGFGRTETGDISETLQKTHGEILTNSECMGHWGRRNINDGHICIHNTQSGSCSGDSGGPLTCYTESGRKPVLSGVTSWGSSYCVTDSRLPSVYTRISHFHQWITDTMNA